jgi:hypothetical protein
MNINRFAFLLSILIFSSSIASAGWFGGPKTYDECIIESMKGVTSDVAASAIRRSCRKKFPIKSTAPKTIELPRSVLEKIDANAHFSDRYFGGRIFNGSDWHISTLKISIKDHTSGKTREYTTKAENMEDYNFAPLAPNKAGWFSIVPYNFPKNFVWGIVGGEGYKDD